MIKQGLELKQSQQLVLTPQLQQALRLLQLPTIELQQEIHEAITSNPLLELLDNTSSIDSLTNPEPTDQMASDTALNQDHLSDEMPLDTWQEQEINEEPAFSSNWDLPNHNETLYEKQRDLSLQEHLRWQMHLTPFSEVDQAIAHILIDGINPDGYLTISLTDVVDNFSDSPQSISIAEVEAVLKRLQCFEPVGVGARSLQECLLVQLTHRATTPCLKTAKLIVKEHLALLANHDSKALLRQIGCTLTTLTEAISLIRQLDPYPGRQISDEAPDYLVPDLFVKKNQQGWSIELNHSQLPQLQINHQYAQLANKQVTQQERQFIKQHLQQAKWLIKSLASRQQTLLQVGRCIVSKQLAFFEQGEQGMQPLNLTDIAEELGLHESTISRATHQKYLHCARGVFELKYFFSNPLTTQAGEEISAMAIKALIKQLITDENSKKPLSDSKIADLISKKGIILARRTIAKYRESLSIPPSSQRKKLI